jgi:hypothetical protein
MARSWHVASVSRLPGRRPGAERHHGGLGVDPPGVGLYGPTADLLGRFGYRFPMVRIGRYRIPPSAMSWRRRPGDCDAQPYKRSHVISNQSGWAGSFDFLH